MSTSDRNELNHALYPRKTSSIPVIVEDIITKKRVTYPSITQTIRVTKVSHKHIWECINGERDNYEGKTFRLTE